MDCTCQHIYIVFDIVWGQILLGLWIWRISILIEIGTTSTLINGSSIIYFLLILFCGARIFCAFSITKLPKKGHVYGLIISSQVSIILCIAMVVAFSYSQAELSMSIIGIIFNFSSLINGSMVYKDFGKPTRDGYLNESQWK